MPYNKNSILIIIIIKKEDNMYNFLTTCILFKHQRKAIYITKILTPCLLKQLPTWSKKGSNNANGLSCCRLCWDCCRLCVRYCCRLSTLIRGLCCQMAQRLCNWLRSSLFVTGATCWFRRRINGLALKRSSVRSLSLALPRFWSKFYTKWNK